MNCDRRALFLALRSGEIKAKYKSTVLGYLWRLLTPPCQSAVFFVVFSRFLRFPIEDYFLYLFTGFAVWQFFSNVLTQVSGVFIGNAALVRKTTAPRELFVWASVGAEAVHLLVTLPVLFCLALLRHRLGGAAGVIHLVAGVSLLFLVSCPLALLVALANVYFRDLERILQILLQVYFYLTPVFYSLAQIPERYRSFFRFNPLFSPLELFRAAFYGGVPDPLAAGISLTEGAVLAFAAYFIFRAKSRDIAEEL
ncbi:MAG: ABC transporter permease [Victivallaceae bacterium]|nr:ABC transporter permease [Victivallaceae bacterium]